ncbi:MAG TPA: hypothetical protein PLB83_01590, partial [Bacillota bacterium]|nr:hypothetical protein [Bacillota bacterium]
MNDYLYYGSLGLIIILFIFSTILYKKLRVWKLILVIFSLLVFVVIEFFSDRLTFLGDINIREYLFYYLYLVVIVLAINFKNKIKITQNLTDYDFFELEKELNNTRDSSELLRKRFIQTIGLLNDGLIFYDDDRNGLFMTDEVLRIIDTNNPQITIEEFIEFLHPEDKNSYVQNLK